MVRIGPWLIAGLAVILGLSFGACTQDDAFISFRYAANLLQGHGLVYNIGEPVEGFTNLSWTLLMAAAMALGADPVPASIFLGLASLVGLVLVTARMGRHSGGGLVAATLLAADAWLVLESVEGLETLFYALLLTAAVGRALRERRDGLSHRVSSLLLGLVILTRPEAPLYAILLHIALLLQAWREDGRAALRRQWRATLQAAWIPLLVLAGLEAWRLHTYGDWVPNTFHAKTGGGLAVLPRGLAYLGHNVIDHALIWILVLLGPVLRPRSRGRLPLTLLAAACIGYVVAVGGDFKPTGRFLVPALPFLALLAQDSWSQLWRRIQAKKSRIALATLTLLVGGGGFLSTWSGAAAVAGDRLANLEARRTVGLWLAQSFPPGTTLAIHSAGAIPYYAQLPTIDMWGLTDAHIARMPANAPGMGMAGHEKTDSSYVFSRQPEIYLPEDHLFVLRPWTLDVPPDFPPDFADRYRTVNVPIEGRWLNFWVRSDILPRTAP